MTTLGILMHFLRKFCVNSHSIDKKIAHNKAQNEQVGVQVDECRLMENLGLIWRI